MSPNHIYGESISHNLSNEQSNQQDSDTSTYADLTQSSSKTPSNKDNTVIHQGPQSVSGKYESSEISFHSSYNQNVDDYDENQCADVTQSSSKKPTNKEDKPHQKTTKPKPKYKLTRNPHLEKETWKKYDSEFSDLNKETWSKLRKGELSADKYIDQLNTELASFLESKEELQQEVKEFFKHKPPKTNLLEEMKKKKIELNKKARAHNATAEDRSNASQAVRTYNYLQKIAKEKESVKIAKKEEKEYRNNFWKTAKDVTNGSFGKEEPTPTFDKTTGDKFYKERYEKPVEIDPEELKWFPKIKEPTVPYNLSPYKPKDIMKALSKKDKNSAPGEDGIIHEYLQKMPTLHKLLATAFTKIRDTGEAPDNWAKSKIILIKKDENATDDDPTHFRMISLTFNIGKLYHTLEAERTMNFMVSNKYLDPAAQKAYVEGVNGCVEHTTVVQEVIQHAQLNHKTAHMTWFDLEDAFGSVSHMLIPIVMAYYSLPTQIINYITNIYKKLKGKVVTPNWESEIFSFLKGVFQGDCFSGVIFLIVFNPIIEYIKHMKETHGYKLETKTSVKFVTTTPFADDFNLISRNITKHQILVTDVENKLISMGLVLKPRKCRSLSIEGGKYTNVQFHLKNRTSEKPVNILSVLDKPLKFLGSEVTSDNTPSAMYVFLNSKLTTKLENIDKCTLRGEYKLNIYRRYALPSIRFYFSVHNIHKTHLENLDNQARKFIKKWLGIQRNGVSDASVFHPYMLGVKMPSQLYIEAHAGTYAAIRLKGDELVNHAVDSRLERESEWTRKFSTVTKAHNIFQENVLSGQITFPENSDVTSTNITIKKAKKAIKTTIQAQTLSYWNNRVKKTKISRGFYQLAHRGRDKNNMAEHIKSDP